MLVYWVMVGLGVWVPATARGGASLSPTLTRAAAARIHRRHAVAAAATRRPRRPDTDALRSKGAGLAPANLVRPKGVRPSSRKGSPLPLRGRPWHAKPPHDTHGSAAVRSGDGVASSSWGGQP